MIYNYQQDVNMRAFRMAMADAYTKDTPGADTSLVLLEDKHIPDPQDMFGIGDVASVGSGADVIWGNTLMTGYAEESDLPRIKYVINDPEDGGAEVEYTTNAFRLIQPVETTPDPDHVHGFYIQLPGQERQYVEWSDVRCYWPSGDNNTPKQAMVYVGSYEKEIIDSIALISTWPMLSIIGVGSDSTEHGDPIDRILLLDPARAEINLAYTNLNACVDSSDDIPDVNEQTLQGILYDKNIKINRDDKLTLEEKSGAGGYWKSVDSIDTTFSITHRIGKNDGTEVPFEYNLNIGPGVSQTWTVSK
jgi:hypothetical protein